jgi:hypothetical protein
MKRWPVVGRGVGIAGLLAAGFCLLGLPPAATIVIQVHSWLIILTGPTCATGIMPGPAWTSRWDPDLFNGLAVAGWCGLPLTFAHPIRPAGWSAAATIFGLTLWFGAGWSTVWVILWGF